jgi:hypothetical protein
MATSLMALFDVSDNGLRIRGSKLKFGHTEGLVSPVFTGFFLNANVSASERVFIIVAQLCRTEKCRARL